MVRTSTRMFGDRLVVTLRWVPAHLPATVRLLAHGGDTIVAARGAESPARALLEFARDAALAPFRRILG